MPRHRRLGCEEVFGPVLAAMPFTDEADAVRIANATDFGLVAGVWTKDGGRQLRMARAIRSGQVFVNNYGAGGGVELPFGGVKPSGYGREKGFEALYGFTRAEDRGAAAWLSDAATAWRRCLEPARPFDGNSHDRRRDCRIARGAGR